MVLKAPLIKGDPKDAKESAMYKLVLEAVLEKVVVLGVDDIVAWEHVTGSQGLTVVYNDSRAQL